MCLDVRSANRPISPAYLATYLAISTSPHLAADKHAASAIIFDAIWLTFTSPLDDSKNTNLQDNANMNR